MIHTGGASLPPARERSVPGAECRHHTWLCIVRRPGLHRLQHSDCGTWTWRGATARVGLMHSPSLAWLPSNTFASTIRTCGAHRIHRPQCRHGAREPIVWLNLAFSPGAYVLLAALECSERVWLTIVVQYHCACCCRAMCSDCCAVWPLI